MKQNPFFRVKSEEHFLYDVVILSKFKMVWPIMCILDTNWNNVGRGNSIKKINTIVEIDHVTQQPKETCQRTCRGPSSSDSFTNLEFRIYELFQRIFVMIYFSTGKLRKKMYWTRKKFVFFFNCWNSEKFHGKK